LRAACFLHPTSVSGMGGGSSWKCYHLWRPSIAYVLMVSGWVLVKGGTFAVAQITCPIVTMSGGRDIGGFIMSFQAFGHGVDKLLWYGCWLLGVII